ncbi:MAG: amidohydrolase family protein [Candidatus Aminicenantes bacterium]|nr:amidohydrolase family protein [Candidatus Aminicenantes bacterium]
MTAKAKFTSIFVLRCFFLFSFSFLLMMSISGKHRNEEEFSAPGLCNSQESAGVPIAVIGALIDGTGAEPVPEAVVVIKGRYITAVGPRKEIEIPENARVFSFPRGTLLPGFINAHVHSKYDEKRLQLWAREGVTTVRDLAEAMGVPWFTLRDQLRSNPKNARIVAAGPVFTCPDGFFKEFSLIVVSPEDAQEKVNKLIDAGADVIKIGMNSPIFPELSLEIVKAIVETAHSRGKPVAAHVISAHGMGVAVEAGVDDINHRAPIGEKSKELIQQTKAAGIYWIPTLEPRLPAPPGKGRPGRRRKAIDSFKYFLSLGGSVALGSDSGTLPGVQIGMPIKEILLMQEAGMTPMQIIEASTRHAARVCRLENEIGTLQAGKCADLLVVEGNPLEDLNTLTKTRLVIHDGVVIREE